MWGGYGPKIRAEEFAGESFSLRFNSDFSYTNHSQYLKDITLTGTKAINVVVNQLDNNITGNSGDNTVILAGLSSEYTVEKRTDGTILVTDLVDNRDGTNTLSKIEILQFKSSKLTLSTL